LQALFQKPNKQEMDEGLLFLLFIGVVVLLVRLSNFSTRLARLGRVDNYFTVTESERKPEK
jgi:hypothetical protein